MTIDVEKLRRDTPACEHVLHLNHAGASLMPTVVSDTVKEHLDLESRLGGYRAADIVRERVERVYADVATLVGCAHDEVALVDSATRAWQLAFAAVPFEPGDRIICSRTEYASNHLAFLQLQERCPVEIVPIAPDETGAIDLDAFELELELGAALVALTHVPTNGGLVHPASQIAELCRAAGVPLLLDACQSTGQVDLRDVQWDMLAATGRKYLRGPRGTGFLGVRHAMLEQLDPPLMDLHGATWTNATTYEPRRDARRFELWERNWADVLGLGAAVRYVLDCGISELEERIAAVADSLRGKLHALPGAKVHDQGSVQCGIVTFTLDQIAPRELKAWLRERDVNVSVSSRSSTLLDMDDRGLDEVVRASVHALTTEDELSTFCDLLSAVPVPG